MVEDLQHSDAGLNLLEALTSGTAIACSDGSYYLGISTSAFTLQGSTDEGRIDAVNQIPGDADDQTSYRAELGGICGIISVLEALLLAYPHIRTLRLSIIISLDNASAINSCQHSHPPRPDQPCYDLLLDIFYRLKALPIEVTWHKVEGHMREKGKIMIKWTPTPNNTCKDAKTHPGPTCLCPPLESKSLTEVKSSLEFTLKHSTRLSPPLTWPCIGQRRLG